MGAIETNLADYLNLCDRFVNSFFGKRDGYVFASINLSKFEYDLSVCCLISFQEMCIQIKSTKSVQFIQTNAHPSFFYLSSFQHQGDKEIIETEQVPEFNVIASN